MEFLKKPYRWAIMITIIIISFSTFVLLDTFVIPKSKETVESYNSDSNTTSTKENESDTTKETESVVSENSYSDDNIEISIETERKDDTTYYVADVVIKDKELLKTAFAENTYGRNIKEKTSEIAKDHDAILAINGDFYGFRDAGYVLRNGISYRETKRTSDNDEALVIDNDGNFKIINENNTNIDELSSDAWQIISFGPALIKDGEIAVDANDEVAKSMNSNPRTAIGQVGSLHYIVVVSDGRTSESKGFSLEELAEVFEEKGCTVAYNLDGGGSSSMVFMGEVINKPTTNGKRVEEREVSDIVYFGY